LPLHSTSCDRSGPPCADRKACVARSIDRRDRARDKNPLNFVNNFSAVSVELIDELRQTLGGIPLDSKLRTEIGEIADALRSNLDKVVQHGKRAYKQRSRPSRLLCARANKG
jgi:hypothetical protein